MNKQFKSKNIFVHLSENKAFKRSVFALALVGSLINGFTPTSAMSAQSQLSSYIHVSSVFNTDKDTFVDHVNSLMSQKGVGGTCFGAQMDHRLANDEVQKKVEEATIFLKAFKGTEVYQAGTGTLIHNSDGKVLTAYHVSQYSQYDELELKAYNSKGQLLGDFKETAHGSDSDDTRLGRSYGGILDIGVLTITPTTEESKVLLASIEGLDLAKTQRSNDTNPSNPNYISEINGFFGTSDTLGTDHGHSGAALIDRNGLVHGVLSTGRDVTTDKTATVVMHGNSIDNLSQNNKSQDDFTTRRASDASFVSVSDPQILSALGGAGKDIISSFDALPGGEEAFVVGFSKYGCVASEGKIADSIASQAVKAHMDLATSLESNHNTSMDNQTLFDTFSNGNQILDSKHDSNFSYVSKLLKSLQDRSSAIEDNAKMGIQPPRSPLSEPPPVSVMVQSAPPPVGVSDKISIKLPGGQVNWSKDTVKPIWHSIGDYGSYKATLKMNGISVSFENQPLVFLQKPEIQKASEVVLLHNDALSVASNLELTQPLTVKISEDPRGNIMLTKLLDGLVGYPITEGPAIQIISPNGDVKQSWFHLGEHMGKTLETALKNLEEKYPEDYISLIEQNKSSKLR